MEESDVACFFPPPSDIKTVAEFHEMARYAPISANWINADRQGTIIHSRFNFAFSWLPLIVVFHAFKATLAISKVAGPLSDTLP